jgi:divalent metal cation (Fe/Co/Zn/Cd) transporter
MLRRATRLSVASIALSGLIGVTAVTTALSTGALSLLGFGFDAAIDSIASAALIWRFHLERRDPDLAAHAEHVAERVVGGALLVLGAVLATGSLRALIDQGHPATTGGALAIAALGVVGLPPLAVAKYRTAQALPSRALRADSILTALAGALAAVSLISLGLVGAAGITWADAAGGLLISGVLVREGLSSVGLARRGPSHRSRPGP